MNIIRIAAYRVSIPSDRIVAVEIDLTSLVLHVPDMMGNGRNGVIVIHERHLKLGLEKSVLQIEGCWLADPAAEIIEEI